MEVEEQQGPRSAPYGVIYTCGACRRVGQINSPHERRAFVDSDRVPLFYVLIHHAQEAGPRIGKVKILVCGKKCCDGTLTRKMEGRISVIYRAGAARHVLCAKCPAGDGRVFDAFFVYQ